MISFYSLPMFLQTVIYLAMGVGCIFLVASVIRILFGYTGDDNPDDSAAIQSIKAGLFFLACLIAFFGGPWLILTGLVSAGMLS